MSCDVAVSTFIWLASLSADPSAASARLMLVVNAPASSTAPVSALSREPLYADIVGRAKSLKAEVQAYRKATGPLKGFDAFKGKIAALSELDMKGHLDLAQRGTDGDLKCILKGISQDLPKRLDELAKAGPADRDKALSEMSYLLNDNVEVITAPPHPPV